MNRDHAVLILSADGHDISCQHKINSCPAYLVNVGTRLSIELIVEYYNQNYIQQPRIYVALSSVRESFSKIKGLSELNVIEVGKTRGIIETLDKATKSIESATIEVITATTIPSCSLGSFKPSVFISNKLSYQEAWTGVQQTKSGVRFVMKDNAEARIQKSYAFTGRIMGLTKHIRESIDQLTIQGAPLTDLGILALDLYSKYNYELVRCDWLDAGHDHTYVETKRLCLTSRFFNSVEYLPALRSIQKTSSDEEKLSREFAYYMSLPEKHKEKFPRLTVMEEGLEMSSSGKFALNLEYIPYPSLAEVFLYWNVGLNKWTKIIESLRYTFDSFYMNGENPSYLHSTEYLYADKLSMRFHAVRKLARNSKYSKLSNMIMRPHRINGYLVPSLNDQYETLMSTLRGYHKEAFLFVGHGDLCFNNILVEPIYADIRLIDPRADQVAPNRPIGLVDPEYDIAKLSHSFLGLYDSVVNGLFSIQQEDNDGFSLSIACPKDYKYVAEIFKETFSDLISDRNGTIVASLFYSMLPLHREDPDRVAALAAIGSLFLEQRPLSTLTFDL